MGLVINRRLVFIPTYNERQNIQPLYNAIQNLNLDLDLLFLDDNSPDGTGHILDEIQKQNARVFIIHRPKKLGIGSAHKQGIDWAYKNGYQQLLTMDADFTHNPKYIPKLFSALNHYDIAIGSRFLMKNSLKNWSFIRKILSKMANFLTTVALKCPYDTTCAYRAYRLDRMDANHFASLKSTSYSFFFESLQKFKYDHYKITEIPIHSSARACGSSKMSFGDAFKSLIFFLKLCKERF